MGKRRRQEEEQQRPPPREEEPSSESTSSSSSDSDSDSSDSGGSTSSGGGEAGGGRAPARTVGVPMRVLREGDGRGDECAPYVAYFANGRVPAYANERDGAGKSWRFQVYETQGAEPQRMLVSEQVRIAFASALGLLCPHRHL